MDAPNPDGVDDVVVAVPPNPNPEVVACPKPGAGELPNGAAGGVCNDDCDVPNPELPNAGCCCGCCPNPPKPDMMDYLRGGGGP